ncbi:TRAP transporter substrate-binding protein DctP [Chelativorans alearense]|uniref:TRAP transporter substrate-binding protein DctP n=1 Tax=Chelativorans alearense TaxID=2681495 RepID=UPI00248356E8|nr:TRAP transporter substrate-binding protein DctP [Chelativorans alearense]
MRVSGSVPGALVEAFGATPVQMPAGEMYNALQTGLIDGIVTGASAVNDFKLDEVANSYSVGAPLGHIMFYLVMNEARYEGLSQEQRAILDKHTGRGLSQKGEEGWNALAERTLLALRDNPDNTVIDLTEEEVAAFTEIADPLREKLIEDMGAEDVLAAMTGN